MKKMLLISVLFVTVLSVGLVHASFWCYQETANVSTICGGLNNGSYSYVSNSPDQYINYTKPLSAVSSSIWQIKHGNLNTYNVSIPLSCWNYNNTMIQFRFVSLQSLSPVGIGSSTGYCYNGAWIQISNLSESDSLCTNSAPSTISNFIDGDWNTYAFFLNVIGWTTPSDPTNCFGPRLYEEAMWWNITAAWINLTYDKGTITESDTHQFNATFSSDSSIINNNVLFFYNGTSYPASLQYVSGNNYNYIYILPLPLLNTTNSNITQTFYFQNEVTYNDGTKQNFTINGSWLVNKLSIDNCSVNPNNIINITFYDEQSLTQQNGNLKITFYVYKGSTSIYRVLNFSYVNQTNITFCIPSGTNYTVDIFGQYNGSIYSTRDYIKKGLAVGSNTINKVLYLLSTGQSTLIPITTTKGILLFPGALINVNRWYSDLGAFIEVVDGLTDSMGTSYVNLEANNPYYQIQVLDGSSIVYVTPKQKLTSAGTTVSIPTFTSDNSYVIIGNVYASCLLNRTLNYISCTYTDNSGLPASYIFNVTYNLPLSTASACSGTLSVSSGTFACDLSGFVNGTYFVDLYVSYNYGTQIHLYNSIFYKGFVNRLGDAGTFLSFIVFLICFFAGIYSKSGAMLMGILGLWICSVLQILPLEPAAVIGLFFSVVVIIYKSSRNKGA